MNIIRIIGISPLRKGLPTIPPVSEFLRGPAMIPITITAAYRRKARPAFFSPRREISVNGSSDGTATPIGHSPTFGSKRWLEHQPIKKVIRNVDANIKYQLDALSIEKEVSGPKRTWIDVFVIPANRESVPETIRFAEYPQLEASQPHINPATGFLPVPRKAMAERGGIITIQVSDAIFPQVPINAII